MDTAALLSKLNCSSVCQQLRLKEVPVKVGPRGGIAMLTLWGVKQRFCDGISRRDFLKIGAFGAGLTLAEMLRVRALAQTSPKNTLKSAIMIYLPGGPSHLDMYDLKPDAPKEFRGEFRPIATNVPGVHICEHFPRQARMWDKL